MWKAESYLEAFTQINYASSNMNRTKKWFYDFPEFHGFENVIRIMTRPFVRVSTGGKLNKIKEVHGMLKKNGFKNGSSEFSHKEFKESFEQPKMLTKEIDVDFSHDYIKGSSLHAVIAVRQDFKAIQELKRAGWTIVVGKSMYDTADDRKISSFDEDEELLDDISDHQDLQNVKFLKFIIDGHVNVIDLTYDSRFIHLYPLEHYAMKFVSMSGAISKIDQLYWANGFLSLIEVNKEAATWSFGGDGLNLQGAGNSRKRNDMLKEKKLLKRINVTGKLIVEEYE